MFSYHPRVSVRDSYDAFAGICLEKGPGTEGCEHSMPICSINSSVRFLAEHSRCLTGQFLLFLFCEVVASCPADRACVCTAQPDMALSGGNRWVQHMADCSTTFLAFISQSIAYTAIHSFIYLSCERQQVPQVSSHLPGCRRTAQPSPGAVNCSYYLFTQHTVLKYQHIFPEDARCQLCLFIKSPAPHASYSPAATPQQLSPREAHVTTLWQPFLSSVCGSRRGLLLPVTTRRGCGDSNENLKGRSRAQLCLVPAFSLCPSAPALVLCFLAPEPAVLQMYGDFNHRII